MNNIQKAAYELIQEDARFIYAIIIIWKNANNISGNYVGMSMPYIGLFADGAEQWGKKIGLKAPSFNPTEKSYYAQLRQSHKLFEKSYDDYYSLLQEKFSESENYFYRIRRLREKILGYFNVGTDLCNEEYCGNTILCSMYTPMKVWGNKNAGLWLKDMSIVAGKLASHFGCTEFPVYKYDDNLTVKYKDYHFYRCSPLKVNNGFGILLFSILCSINYIIEFIENCFTEEIPQKFKYAYLQYYYLCGFIKELNAKNGTNFSLDDHLYDRNFRNCLAHYGLGQYIREDEIIPNDILKGLTNKAFGKDYFTTKDQLYGMLRSLTEQIKETVLR